jgi:hypothetical protein
LGTTCPFELGRELGRRLAEEHPLTEEKIHRIRVLLGLGQQ